MKKRFLAILLLTISMQFGNINAKKVVVDFDRNGITIKEADPCMQIIAGLSVATAIYMAYLYLTQN